MSFIPSTGSLWLSLTPVEVPARGAVGAVQPRGSHPAASGEGTTEGLSPCLAPHLRDPGHPEPANGEDGHLAGMSSGFGDLGGTE